MHKIQNTRPLHFCTATRVATGLVSLLLLASVSARGHGTNGHATCPVPEGLPENPLASPSITAGQVAANPTAENLANLSVAARDYVAGMTSQFELAYSSCLMRQDGGDWRSEGIYLVSLSFNPEILAKPMAPIDMRVVFHAKNMELGGRLVRPDVAAAILAAASGDPAGGGAVPSLGGHAAQYFPYIMTAGLDLQESHLALEEPDLGLEPPAISASDVVDRASLREFVDGAINHISNLFEVAGVDAGKLRSAFRDESGPWRAGPVYLFVMDETGYTIFHGAFPDKYELQIPTQTLRDVVTGELILPQIIAAATGSGTGDFVEYHFDDPNDDSDSAEIPKVAFAREHTFNYHHPLLGPSTATYIIGSGFYRGRAPSGSAGQEACPLPEGLTENPLSNPSVTAGRAAANPTPENLGELAVAARDYVAGMTSQFELAYSSCLMRQDGGDWRSGDTYLVSLSFNPEIVANPMAPINMRVIFHAKNMGLGGRLVKPDVAATILTAALSDPADGGAVPGLGGHAAQYLPYIMTAGLDLHEFHLAPEESGLDLEPPAISASDVVDRASLREFVDGAINHVSNLFAVAGIDGGSQLRSAFRDESGPWRAGPVYLFVMDETGYTIFHGAFPDKFELQVPTQTLRDVVTGELILPKIIAAATGSETGGFIEYHFDDPNDDSDSAQIPKVAFAREHTFSYDHPLLGPSTARYIIGSGFYRAPIPESGRVWTQGCPERSVVASAVETREDVQTFVECAAAYLAEHGTVEARRAFHEDGRWNHGPMYVFVQPIRESGVDARPHVFPPNPSLEGKPRGKQVDSFGPDLFQEVHRMMQVVDAGWFYYTFPDPVTGQHRPKASYLIEIEWDGDPAVIGAGLYEPDLPLTCYDEDVSAAALEEDPRPPTLRAFVRCAAQLVEKKGFLAKQELETDPRWSSGSSYAFSLDMQGNQVISGHGVRVNGRAPHEWGGRGSPEDQFGGRAMVDVGSTFGEAFVYYRSFGPRAGAHQPKVGLLKRVVAHGVPQLVGAGYESMRELASGGPSCAEHYVTARAIRTGADMQAFVQCAAEYVIANGEAEARRAFNEDARWKHGPIYVFVDSVGSAAGNSLSYVFPPDPAREGLAWGPLVDEFGTDYFFELNRLLAVVDRGWIYYAFTNPTTGLYEPKLSYVREIDWNGNRASIGAGYYPPDVPGTCAAADVNATALESSPTDAKLQQFVRCAALQVEASGYFAIPLLTSSPRWKHGSIYVFGINPETEEIEFSGSEGSFAVSGRINEALFKGRKLVDAVAGFGEGFWYYNFTNPATGAVQAKRAYLKLVHVQGAPLLIGAGYNPAPIAPSN